MSMEWSGADRLIEALEGAAMPMAAEALLAATLPLVPDDKGALKASGRTASARNKAAVGFGTDYAVIQHQRTDYRHDDGEARFLANALDAFGDEFGQILADQASRVIGS